MVNVLLEKREKKTHHAAKKCRRNGMVPGVLYGKGISSMLFEISELNLNEVIGNEGEHSILKVKLDGDEHNALIKEVQRDPVTHKIIHIDLEKVQSDKNIVSTVPIYFKGIDNLTRYGAVIQKEKANIKVSCKPDVLPKFVEVNVGDATIGSVYRVADVELGSEISILDDLNAIIGSVSYENKVVEGVEPEGNSL